MKKSITINATLLPRELQARFTSMMRIASERSIVRWVESDDASTAQVVLKENVSPDDTRFVPIYVRDIVGNASNQQFLHILPDFRVRGLMDVLDLAAVRVMNRWDKHTRTIPSGRTASNALHAERYQLRHWVFLGAERSEIRHARTLAAMTRRPITREWMISSGGLNALEIDAMLDELRLRGALITTTESSVSSKPESAAASDRLSLVRKITRWIGGHRSKMRAATP